MVPWLGVLIYLIARGSSMNERAIRDAQASGCADACLRPGRGRHQRGSNVSSELKELAALRDAGTISPEEYEQAKAKVLA